MEDIPQWAVNWLLSALVIMFGVGTSTVGWVVGRLHRRLDDLTAADATLTESVHRLALIVAGLQQYQTDTTQFRFDVREQLKYIVERLDDK